MGVSSGSKGAVYPFWLVGESQCMQQLKKFIHTISDRDCTVLIQGETGTGKEMVARYIHYISKRSAGPFVPVDCAVLQDTLFASQLFGHVKGAFTGAISDSVGFFRSAHNGTLFLDEIGEMDLNIQAKLLRSIQEKAVIPLGGVKPIPVDVRIIAATCRDLKSMVLDGRFREDLYYRLNVISIRVPPLRERPEDIITLAKHFIERLSSLYNEPVKILSSEVEQIFLKYSWPGNVRELSNVVERAYILSEGRIIKRSSLPKELIDATSSCENIYDGESKKDLRNPSIPTLDEITKKAIKRALEYTGGKKIAAAKLLGIERRRLNRFIRKYGINIS